MFIAIVKKVNCTPSVAFSSLPLLSGKSKTFCSVLHALVLARGNLERWTGEKG